MANNEEASPICRGKNLSWETVLLLYNNMPKVPMAKSAFHSYVEARIIGWTQTHSQIARQLAFYYEKNGICYPRFNNATTYVELLEYMQNWASKYFIPNPYTPSLRGRQPICIYSFLKNNIHNGNIDFDSALDSMFDIKLSSHDKVNVYLSNFTDILIDNKHIMSINESILFQEPISESLDEYSVDYLKYYEYFTLKETTKDFSSIDSKNYSIQQIYYGAPGTGKSHKIDEITNKNNSIRTTFHPDSDYASFVGCYKPIAKDMEEGRGEITYDFVPQAFTTAYIEAWKDTSKPYYLVIEEINRGNCAQIFGDIFQLLDRGENGMSSYEIKPDTDLAQYLAKTFTNEEIEDEKIKTGEVMRLPSNLHILATMNTSDQSLFPIDSAFKRRWEWKYIPIKDEGKNHKIVVGDTTYDWWEFIEIVNARIEDVTDSEDKQIGYWFAKADNENRISAETLVSKVIFYLWNDVFKDYAHSNNSLFHIENRKYKFREFYLSNGDINIELLNKFLSGLKWEDKVLKAETPKTEEPQESEE